MLAAPCIIIYAHVFHLVGRFISVKSDSIQLFYIFKPNFYQNLFYIYSLAFIGIVCVFFFLYIGISYYNIILDSIFLSIFCIAHFYRI